MIKLKFYLMVLTLCFISVDCQNWGTRACLVNQIPYYMNIMQETISRIERDVKWCNFKVGDVNQVINERLFKWHAQGTVNYTNGFLVKFDNIDVSNILGQFSTRTVNGTTENIVSVNGLLNFRLANVGFDVIANIDDFDTSHFTGIFSFRVVSLRCAIIHNLSTKEVSVTSTLVSSTAAERRMVYRPQNKISELLSRHFMAFHASGGLSQWGQLYIAPIIEEIAIKTDLPEIRFDNRC